MEDVRRIREMLETAGELAMRRFLKVTPSRKANRSYVTEADLAVQAFLKQTLETWFPEDGIIAEEDNLRKKPARGDRYWIVDPIDGTASFVAGLPAWGIALGLVERHQPRAGFFWMPTSRDFFYAAPDGLVYRNNRPARLKPPAPLHRESLMLAHGRLHRRYTISADYPGKVRGLGSAIAHLCFVATGSADIALIPRVFVWDLAAGMALLVRNGGALRYLNGEAVTLSDLIAGAPAPYPMLCGHAEAIARYAPLITYRPAGPV